MECHGYQQYWDFISSAWKRFEYSICYLSKKNVCCEFFLALRNDKQEKKMVEK